MKITVYPYMLRSTRTFVCHLAWRPHIADRLLGRRVLGQVRFDPLAIGDERFSGAFFPCEHAHRRDAVEPDLRQRGEEVVPAHFTLTDIQVLMDSSRCIEDATAPVITAA